MTLRIQPSQFSVAFTKGNYDFIPTHQLLDEIQSIFSKVSKESGLNLRESKPVISKLNERRFKPLTIGILFSLFPLLIPALVACWMVWQNRKIHAACLLITQSKPKIYFTPTLTPPVTPPVTPLATSSPASSSKDLNADFAAHSTNQIPTQMPTQMTGHSTVTAKPKPSSSKNLKLDAAKSSIPAPILSDSISTVTTQEPLLKPTAKPQAATKSQVTESQATESQATESQVTESQATESQVTESQVTESQATESQATDSSMTESKVTLSPPTSLPVYQPTFQQPTLQVSPPQPVTLSFKDRAEIEAKIADMKLVLPPTIGAYFNKNILDQVLTQPSLTHAYLVIANWLDSAELAGDISFLQNRKACDQLLNKKPAAASAASMPKPSTSFGQPSYELTSLSQLPPQPSCLGKFPTKGFTLHSSHSLGSQLAAEGAPSSLQIQENPTSTPVFKLVDLFLEAVQSHATPSLYSYFQTYIASRARLEPTEQKSLQILQKWVFSALYFKKINPMQFTALMAKLSELGFTDPFIIKKSSHTYPSLDSMGPSDLNSYSKSQIHSISQIVQAFNKEVHSILNPKIATDFDQTTATLAAVKNTAQESVDVLQQWIFDLLYCGRIAADEAFELQKKLHSIGESFTSNSGLIVDTGVKAKIWSYLQLLQPMLNLIPIESADDFLTVITPKLLEQTAAQKVMSLVNEWITQSHNQGKITDSMKASLSAYLDSVFPPITLQAESPATWKASTPALTPDPLPAWKTAARIGNPKPYIPSFDTFLPPINLSSHIDIEKPYCNPWFLEQFKASSKPHTKLKYPSTQLYGDLPIVQFYRDHETPDTALFGNSEYCPCGVTIFIQGQHVTFHNAEAAYQAIKIIFIQSSGIVAVEPGLYETLLSSKTGEEAHPTIKKINQLMPPHLKQMWAPYSPIAMCEIVKAKFCQDPIFAAVLLSQKNKVFIYNSGDQISNWSVSPNNNYAGGPSGKNWMGHILMKLANSSEIQEAASQTTFSVSPSTCE